MNNIGSLGFREAGELREALEELTTFDELGDDVVVLGVFDQVDYSDNVRVRFFTKYGKLVLQ